jgi:hypothetical protein
VSGSRGIGSRAIASRGIASRVDAGIIDHRETRLPSPRAAQGGAAQPPHQISAHTEHREHDDEGDQELYRNRQVIEEFHRSAPSPPRNANQPDGSICLDKSQHYFNK